MNAKDPDRYRLVLSLPVSASSFAQVRQGTSPRPSMSAPAKLTRSRVIATLKVAPAAETAAQQKPRRRRRYRLDAEPRLGTGRGAEEHCAWA